MEDLGTHMKRMHVLSREGRYGELLAFLQQRYQETEATPAPARTDYFMTMFQWKMLIEAYPPAAEALASARDEQVHRLLAGDRYTGTAGPAGADIPDYKRVEHFTFVIEMNEMLGDPHATHALFLQLEKQRPELAREYAWQALPAIVEAGDYVLAERYRGEPLRGLANVNRTALTWPLFPPGREAPRLIGELTILTREVRIAIAVLCGLGCKPEAEAVREALLSGLQSEELRALAARELDEPGTITRVLVEHQMAQEDMPTTPN